MNRIATAGLVGLLGGLSGCETAHYKKGDTSRFPMDAVHALAYEADHPRQIAPLPGAHEAPSYAQAQALERTYGILPAQHLTFYHIEKGTNVAKAADLNFTGPLNTVYDDVDAIRKGIPYEEAPRTRLILANPDRNTFASARSAGNQFSSEDGILGIDVYGENGKFFIDMHQRTGFSMNGREQHDYQVAITFGAPAFEMMKTRTDWSVVSDTARGAVNGAVAATIFVGPSGFGPGLAGGATIPLVDAAYAFWEGGNAPLGMTLSEKRSMIRNDSVSHTVADTLDILNHAKDRGANNLIMFEREGETAFVYARDAYNVRVDSNTLYFEMDRQGANHLKMALLGLAETAIGAGTARALYNPSDDTSGRRGGSGPGGGGGRTGGGSGGIPPRP